MGTEKIKKMPIFMTLDFMALYLVFSSHLRSAKVGSGASFFLLCPDGQKLMQKRQISSIWSGKIMYVAAYTVLCLQHRRSVHT